MTTVFIPIEKLDKNIRYEIVGSPKCGTTSLGKYLRGKGYDVLESELTFFDIEKAHNHNYWDRTPIIVTRNPIERAYSDYKAFNRTLKESCDWSYFKVCLQMWDALIYSLEYLKTIPNFPHENNGNRDIISHKIKKEIIKELKQ